MSLTSKLSSILLLAVLAAGCTSTVTNLTPSRQARNATGVYPVEAIWDTNEQAVRLDSIKPVVIIDQSIYPMRRTIGMSNRWEAVIPVPADKNSVLYQFKFDFEYNRFGKPGKDSKLSAPLRLDIVDK